MAQVAQHLLQQVNHMSDGTELLSRTLDDLLEHYLHLLHRYQALQQDLYLNLSKGYISLAQANFSNPNRIHYGQDFYDERMQATAYVSVDVTNPTFSIIPPPSSSSTPPPNDNNGKNPQSKLSDSINDRDNGAETPKKESVTVSEPPPRDPLNWFGILLPPALRQSQAAFKSAATEIIPSLSRQVKLMEEHLTASNSDSKFKMTQQSLLKVMEISDIDLVPYEALYKHFHCHPELSLQERETAATAASHLRKLNAGFEIHTNIGGHGLAAVLRNGEGKTVLLRADMDALPVEEDTGLPYASKVTMRDSDCVMKPVMHACGHDMHVTCLLAAAEQLSRIKFAWSGTLIVVFQPNEERAGGAQAMINDGLYSKIPIPDIVLGQHVMADRAGYVGSTLGTIMAAADSFKITIYGRGGHGSMPHRTIDPVVMAANIVVRLQTIVNREVNPSDMAVVTVGALQAGQTENIIADKAELKVNVRTINAETREQVLKAIKRIVKAECEASNSPKEPLIESTSTFPLTVNSKEVTQQLATSFTDVFPSFNADTPRVNASEDFSILGTAINRPTSFWFFGGVDPDTWDEKEKEGRVMEDIPVNHSPFFAPVVQPTLRTGVRALCVGAMTFFTRRIL